MERIDLPRPTSAHDMYMFDQCLSLRLLADLVVILIPQVPIPADGVTELREPGSTGSPAAPKPKARTRDELQATDPQTAQNESETAQLAQNVQSGTGQPKKRN